MQENVMIQKHFAFFLPNLAMGGAERVFITLARGFEKKGYIVDLVVGKADGLLLNQIPKNVNLINLSSSNILTTLVNSVVYLRKAKPDVAFSTLDLMSIILLCARFFSLSKSKIIVEEASVPSAFPRKRIVKLIQPYILNYFFNKADKVIAVSKGVAQDLHDYAKIPFAKIRTIYNPVIPADFENLVSKDVGHTWIETNEFPIVLSVGSLTKRKNHALLISAFASIASKTNARLVILGEGDERSELEKMAKSHGLEHRISLPGSVQYPLPYMKKARVFVLPSLLEGLANVVVEALACGCQVVCTNCPNGPREILDNGKHGRLVQNNNAAELANAILDLLNTQRYQVDEDWLSQFREDVIIDHYLSLVNEIL